LITARDDENANKRAGHKIDAHGRRRIVARKNGTLGQRPRQSAAEERIGSGAVAAARTCKSVLEHGEAQ